MSGETILVIDDSREIVKHLCEHVLPTFGYKTMYAYDGRSGMQLIREQNPDLVMLDYNLPEMNGIDVLQQMAQESISTPVVIMTGYGSELSAIEAFRLGAKDYLIKPFTVDEIVETIDRALVETRLLHDKQELVEQLRRVKVEMSRQTHEMNTLFNIGKAITSLLSVDKILERVLEAATYLTGAEESTIWLLDNSRQRLQVYQKGDHSEHEGKRPVEIDLSMTDLQLAQVIRTGRPLRQSVFSGKGIKVDTGYFARAVLYTPLKLRGVTIGVLGVSNLEAFRAFSKRDEFLLSFLADYAAIALENARVYQAADQALAARLEELNTLIDITHTITSSLDLDEVLQNTIQQVHNSWHIEASSVWLLDEARQTMRVLTNVGTPDDVLTKVEVPVGEGFVGHVAKTGKWIYTNDVSSHPIHYKQVDAVTGFKTESLLCVPLMFRGRVMGALQLLNKQNGNFDDQDVEKALSIAAAVAIAVTNALLFHEAETRKQHLEVTLEHNNNPIFITDEEGRLVVMNRTARERLGVPKAAIGQPVMDVLPMEELVALLTGEETAETIREITLADGSTWLPRVAPIPEHGRILIMQDITSLRELEKAKDHFVATVSHDMRAPLNTIRGFANNLEIVGPLNDEQKQCVAQILMATDQMMTLVNGLLELAKVGSQISEGRELCDIHAIVTEVLHAFQGPAMAKGVTLLLTADEQNMGLVLGNRGQIYRAISNLVDNAIKYSLPNHKVQIVLTTQQSYVLLEVHDEGIGIPEVDLPHIFEKFYRGHNVMKTAVDGTGLGLALVDSIVKAHQGQIWVESQNGQGSTFYMRLPIAQSENLVANGGNRNN
ncbi:MAG: response regulator [Chloroflexi bacterium]|nr:MAG: response regulator [Chloroflexota bacterium]